MPEVHIVAAGDVLIHAAVKRTAREAAGAGNEGYDAVFEAIAPRIRAADVAFANLETPIAPVSKVPVQGEVFDAPPAVPAALAAAGFDVVSLANNHAWDQGAPGVLETARNVAAAGLVGVGAGATCDEAAAYRMVEANGVRIAFVATVDLLNLDSGGGPGDACVFAAGPHCTANCGPDRDAIPLVFDVDRVLVPVRAARAAGADLVVLSVHWGIEWRTTPLDYQPGVAQRLVDGGVDVILGHHAHVLLPVERLTAADGREALVAFGLGNLVSDMGKAWTPGGSPTQANTRTGALLAFTVVDEGERVRITDVAVEPTWTENNYLTRGEGPTKIRPVVIADVLAAGGTDAEVLRARRTAAAAIVGEGWVTP